MKNSSMQRVKLKYGFSGRHVIRVAGSQEDILKPLSRLGQLADSRLKRKKGAVLPSLGKFIENNEKKGDRLAFISDTRDTKEGLDLYIGSMNVRQADLSINHLNIRWQLCRISYSYRNERR